MKPLEPELDPERYILPHRPHREWHENRTRETWELLKIQGEFVQGFDKMSAVGPCVSIFGSARIKPHDPIYQDARRTAQLLVEHGFGVVTGGGPGIMQAGNQGATEAQGMSVGLTIRLPMEETTNPYVDRNYQVTFDYFFVRKVLLMRYAQGVIVFPGGYGTLDELFETLTLIQTHKIEPFPVVLVNVSYWQGLIHWIRERMLADGYISTKDPDMFTLVDTPEEAVDIVTQFYRLKQHRPNF
jgi:uncharacterized protein (TIGR00730 family)